jgi:hypothetical protein
MIFMIYLTTFFMTVFKDDKRFGMNVKGRDHNLNKENLAFDWD